MMLAQDGTKLSKRHGAVSVGEYQKMGIPPVGLLNYLVRFGWSFGDEEVFPMEELIAKFGWDRCSKADGKFDAKKLGAIAFEHLKRPDLMSDDAYLDGLTPHLAARGLTASRDRVRACLPLYRERGQTWLEAAELMDYVLRDEPVMDEKAQKKFLVAANAPTLVAVAELFESAADFEAKPLEERFLAFLAERGLEMKHVAQPVRVALTGRTASPGLYELAVLLGKSACVARLRRAAELAAQAG
jgi:glutamyl-tRNA synthetase